MIINKLLALTIIGSMMSILGISAMEKTPGENVAPTFTAQPSLGAMLKKEREDVRKKQQAIREGNRNNNSTMRRNLNPEIDLHDPNGCEGACTFNNNF